MINAGRPRCQDTIKAELHFERAAITHTKAAKKKKNYG